VQDIEHIAEQFVQYLRGFGASQSNREPINLAALVDERVRRWVSAGHDVCVSVSPNSPVMSGDSVALSRVVDNLIGNAIQHGAPPIELEITAGESGRVSLVVRDHGSGIPDAEQPHALEPFTKVSQARGSKGSVGLGLAIVARVVRSHGGDLQLRNRENEGFEVQVTFAPATSPT
jgi:two-component system osmolarity sensor histidine kinase EnvZ